MPGDTFVRAYTALASGDRGPLLAMLNGDFEWVEPELAGYPLSGVHRGPEGVGHVLDRLAELFDDFLIETVEVIDAGDRVVATGVMRGRPSGADAEWELPFAHVWNIDSGVPRFASAYFDRSRLTLAAARRQLTGVADDLLEQAAEIRRQWARLGDAVRAASGETPPGDDEPEGTEEGAGATPYQGSASVRLAAVDLAHDGATREDVEAFLRDEHGVEDTAPILEEIFGPPAADSPEPVQPPEGERPAEIEATRLSRIFARNRP